MQSPAMPTKSLALKIAEDTSVGHIFWAEIKILNSESHDLGLLSLCLFFNFWMIKFTIMCFFDIHTWNFSSKVPYNYMSKSHNFFKKYTNWAKLSHFWEKCVFWHVEDLSWDISCMNVKKNHNCEFYHSKIEK